MRQTAACIRMERGCAAAGDVARLRQRIDVHERLNETLLFRSNPEAQVSSRFDLEVARAWFNVLNDERGPSEAALLDPELARNSIQMTALMAFRALRDSRFDQAISMAQQAVALTHAHENGTFDRPLALLTLARAYRYDGQPNLALAALGRISSSAFGLWTAWASWERMLAGGVSGTITAESAGMPNSLPGGGVMHDAALRLQDLFAALRIRSRLAVEGALADLQRSVVGCRMLAAEVDALMSVVNPRRQRLPRSIQSWAMGQGRASRCAFLGVAMVAAPPTVRVRPSAMVLGLPGLPGRRFLAAGTVFVADARLAERTQMPASSTRTRSETGLAVLALAGPTGISCDEFFRTIYGLRFCASRHQSVLDVLCYRIRALLGDAGDLQRSRRRTPSDPGSGIDSKMWLVLHGPIIVADPRCGLSTAGRILHAVALASEFGGLSMSQIASEITLPVRTVQLFIQDLVQSGQCLAVRRGRHLKYRVKDPVLREDDVSRGGEIDHPFRRNQVSCRLVEGSA